MRNFLRAAAVALQATVLMIPFSASAQQPSLDTRGLGVGACSTMNTLLEKTIFNVDILRLKIRYDTATAAKFGQIAQGKPYSSSIEQRVATVAYQAKNVFAELRFERDISLDDFVEAVRESLKHAQKAGMITPANQRKVSQQLPVWFGFLKTRGIQSGDRILYRVRPNSLRTVYLGVKGKKYLDQVDSGKDPRLALLSGYFAPGADLREGLASSVCR